MTDDVAVRIPSGKIRRSEITIDCGKGNDRNMTAAKPRVVVEVLSPSTMSFDRFRKLEEYKSHPAIVIILLVDTEAPQATIHRRDGEIWRADTLEGLAAAIDLPEIEAKSPLAELYEGIAFDQI